MTRHRLLFVCLGNICRSPMAEGVFRRLVAERGLSDRFEIDSAGIGNWHEGQAPDSRAQAASMRRGIDISRQSARQLRADDFSHFDLILAMDGSNHGDLQQLSPKQTHGKLRHFLDFATHTGTRDVPDPFFGGDEDFDHALDLIEAAAKGLLKALVAEDDVAAKVGAHRSSG
jgi:protein-tyrosine phosphatase